MSKHPVPAAIPGLATQDKAGWRERLFRRLFPEATASLELQQRETLRLQVAIERTGSRSLEELLELRGLLEARLSEQAAAIDRLRRTLQAAEEQLSLRRQEIESLRERTDSRSAVIEQRLTETARHGQSLAGFLDRFKLESAAADQQHQEALSDALRNFQLAERNFEQRIGRWTGEFEGRVEQARLETTVSGNWQREAVAEALQRLELAERRLDERIVAWSGELEGRAERARLEFTAAGVMQNQTVERWLQRLEETHIGAELRLARIADPVGPDFDYTAFEDRFRGLEVDIRGRQEIYLPLLGDYAPVFDLGSGRGEMLELLRESGIEAAGVEINLRQIERCRAKGLRVVEQDLLDWAGQMDAGAAGGLLLLQVVEHLDLADLLELLREGRRVLRPGGVLLMETVNPHCAEAMEWFYIDPTHRRPVYPEMLQFLLEQAGYRDISIRYQIQSPTAAPGGTPTAKTGLDFAIWGFTPPAA